MTVSAASIVSAVAFLAIGVFGYALVNRFVYPLVRRHHEEAKLTGRQGADPRLVFSVLRFAALVAMPVLGFLLGDRLASLF